MKQFLASLQPALPVYSLFFKSGFFLLLQKFVNLGVDAANAVETCLPAKNGVPGFA